MWSLSNIVVVYDRVRTYEDILDGTTLVNVPLGQSNSPPFAWQGLTGGLGPTEQSVTFPIPLLDYSPVVNVSLGTTLQYNVTISNSITLDQNATLNSLSVQAGGQLSFQPGYSLVLRSGNSVNAGTVTGANLTVQSSASLNNQGSFQWTSGNILGNGGLTNQGSLAITGNVFTGSNVSQTIGAWYTGGFTAPGVLTNAGTITHAAGNLLLMYGGSTLNNLAGAVYDIQGDGYGSLGNVISGGGDTPGNTINNAGLFRKSAGSGTAAVVGAFFNNTGTVEVDSGTLAF